VWSQESKRAASVVSHPSSPRDNAEHVFTSVLCKPSSVIAQSASEKERCCEVWCRGCLQQSKGSVVEGAYNCKLLLHIYIYTYSSVVEGVYNCKL
jgi:hypothetical protein